MFGNEKSTKDRQKERERKKRGTRKYGQAKLKHCSSLDSSRLYSYLFFNEWENGGIYWRAWNFIYCSGYPWSKGRNERLKGERKKLYYL